MHNLEYDNTNSNHANGAKCGQAGRVLRAITASADQARALLHDIPGLAALASFSLAMLGVKAPQVAHVVQQIVCVHFFHITESLQGSYNWHTDCRDLCCLIGTGGKQLSGSLAEKKAWGIRSVVVQLSPTEETAMCMWGCQPSVYSGRGAGKAFHGSALHCGIPWNLDHAGEKLTLHKGRGGQGAPQPHWHLAFFRQVPSAAQCGRCRCSGLSLPSMMRLTYYPRHCPKEVKAKAKRARRCL